MTPTFGDDGCYYVPGPGEPTELDAYLVWRCGWCDVLWLHAPRCTCGADLPTVVGGDVELMED